VNQQPGLGIEGAREREDRRPYSGSPCGTQDRGTGRGSLRMLMERGRLDLSRVRAKGWIAERLVRSSVTVCNICWSSLVFSRIAIPLFSVHPALPS